MILTWPQRINIALGVARALSWLHHLCNLHVVHLNICSRSILLDKNFEPKLSNFGDAKFLNPNNHESLGMSFYIKDGKKDVYDFGNVIFELVTGKLYEELVENSCNNANLSPNPSSFYSAIDKFIIGEGFESEAFMLIKIACECVQPPIGRYLSSIPFYDISAKFNSFMLFYYWVYHGKGVEASMDGVLGGFANVNKPDIKCSEEFLKIILSERFPADARHQPLVALDCGSGIGRITKNLLIRHFNEVYQTFSSLHCIYILCLILTVATCVLL
ncbi:hypothetical protein AHAS_Ahas19G0303900 [Arachis hypogaea]